MSRAAAQAVDTLAVGMSWEVGSASEHPCFRALTGNGDINLTLTQVRLAQRHMTLTTNLQSPEASKTTQITELRLQPFSICLSAEGQVYHQKISQ